MSSIFSGDADSKSAPMLSDTEDGISLPSGKEMTTVSNDTARVVDGSSVNVAVAQARPEDTEHLRRKENVFFALFRKPLVEIQRVNPRISKAVWGEINPLFISKLLVSFHFPPSPFFSSDAQIDPPPVIMDDEGQVQNEEDRESMTGFRLIRTMMLFRDEWVLLSTGIFILFFQMFLSTYLPQLTKTFNEASSVSPVTLLSVIIRRF